MFGLYARLRETYYKMWLDGFRRKNPHVRFGENIRLNGIPIFSMSSEAEIFIGGGTTFISRPASNLVGLCRACSIGVGDNALLNIGEHCGFSGVAIYCAQEIRIGAYLTCGGNVSIWDTDFHPLDAAARRRRPPQGVKADPIIIGDDVFIGAHALILKGVTIGDRAVIGAGSIVTKDVGAGEIWAGNPAKAISHSKAETA